MKRQRSSGGKKNATRLHKYVANCGYCSRRRAELLIERGLVQVNGKAVSAPGHTVDPKKDIVTINGEEIRPPQHVTIMLNKPAETISQTHDSHDRITVMDLLPQAMIKAGVLPAGRLDYETEGLLIMTNDGDLLHRITHPSFGCEKEYKVHLRRYPTRSEKRRLLEGFFVPALGKRTQPARYFDIQRRPDDSVTLHLAIREGMKRQIRRVFEYMKNEVLHLERLAIGDLRLGDLPRGEWRELDAIEIESVLSGTDKPPPRM